MKAIGFGALAALLVVAALAVQASTAVTFTAAAPQPIPPSVTVYLVGTVDGVLTIFNVYQSWQDCWSALQRARNVWGMTNPSVASSLKCTTTPYAP